MGIVGRIQPKVLVRAANCWNCGEQQRRPKCGVWTVAEVAISIPIVVDPLIPIVWMGVLVSVLPHVLDELLKGEGVYAGCLPGIGEATKTNLKRRVGDFYSDLGISCCVLD